MMPHSEAFKGPELPLYNAPMRVSNNTESNATNYAPEGRAH